MTKKEEELRAKKFQLIGEFIFQFSQLEFSIRARLSELLNLYDSLFDIVTAPYDCAKLCTVTQQVLVVRHPTAEKAIKDLFSRCWGLNDERTRVAHGTWAEGPVGLASRHVSRSKLIPQWYYGDALALQKHIEEARQLVMAVVSVRDKTSPE